MDGWVKNEWMNEWTRVKGNFILTFQADEPYRREEDTGQRQISPKIREFQIL